MRYLDLILCSLLLSIICTSCSENRLVDDYSEDEYSLISEELNLPQTVFNYELELGEHFLPPGEIFPEVNNNALGGIQQDNNKATLGRVLFYDQNLSLDRQISCGSCHKVENAFADDSKLSEGVNAVSTKRNSLALATTLSFKISYSPIDASLSRSKFSWDDAALNLEDQVKLAFENENEMNVDEDLIKTRISEKSYYPILFENAFGDSEVDADRIAEAITTFVDAISAVNSKFDEGLENAPSFDANAYFHNFTEKENQGKTLYNTHCAVCHTDKHNFTVKATANNGLDFNYEDKGVGGRINNPSLFGVFKVPFLRNIGLTAPYMHDGRFETLRDVVDHYSDDVKGHRNLSKELTTEDGQVKRLHLSEQDKESLVAYLHTLTDHKLMEDERFTDPFIR